MEKTLLLTDLHGNNAALQAILSTPEARSCRRIISLGDQVNFGPESRAVVDTLRQLDAVMLLGNHEERLTHLADFSGYNWTMLHCTARQLSGVAIGTLPVDVRIGDALLTHGAPGDPYHLIMPEALPQVLSALPDDVRLLLSGHNHLRWDVEAGGKCAVNPGSAGMNETGTPCAAMFAVWDDEALTMHSVPYDPSENFRAYFENGFVDAAPEMTRACMQEMLTGEYQGVLTLIRHVRSVAEQHGMTLADREAWQLADRTFAWRVCCTTPEYWEEMRKSL